MEIAKKSGLAGVAIFISRILGLLREQTFAALFGAGFYSDAFLVAYRLPNLFRDLFAEGALSTAFVSVLSKESTHQKQKELSKTVFIALFWCLLAILLVASFFTNQFLEIIATNFKSVGEKFEITHQLTRILMPSLFFASMAAYSMGILNSLGSFFLPSLSPAFYNLGSVLFGGSFAFYYIRAGDYKNAILAFTLASLFGSSLQWIVQWPLLIKKGFSPFENLKYLLSFKEISKAFKNPKLHKIVTIMFPALLSAAFVQMSLFINTSFASRLEEGSVSFLAFSYRLLHFPMGLFGVSLSLATLASLSRVGRHSNEFKNSLARSLRLSLVLAWGAMLGLVFLGRPIIAMIFQHGRFDEFDTYETYKVLIAYAVGLLAFNFNKILLSAFYAMEKVLIPSVLAALALFLNYILAEPLGNTFGASGLAISVSLAGFLKLLLMSFFLYKMKLLKFNTSVFRLIFLLLISSVPLIIFYFSGLEAYLFEILHFHGKSSFIAAVLLSVSIMGGIYLLSIRLFQGDLSIFSTSEM